MQDKNTTDELRACGAVRHLTAEKSYFFGQPRWLKRAKHAGYYALFKHYAAFTAALSLTDALLTSWYLFDLILGMHTHLSSQRTAPGFG